MGIEEGTVSEQVAKRARNAALEEAARVCEQQARTAERVMHVQQGNSEVTKAAAWARNGAVACAAAIRALKEGET